MIAYLAACGDAHSLAARDDAREVGSSGPSPVSRVVSVNPSLTAILLALGARDVLVGVDDFSALQEPEVAELPRVGGLFNPSLEAVAALEPEAVVLVPSVEQRDFRSRLEALGVRVLVFRNIRFDEVLENITRLGVLVGREAAARQRVAAIRATRAAAAELTAAGARPRTLLVLQREPVFVVGRGSFIDDMLRAAGANNLGAEFDEPYPRVAVEWLVGAGPEVLIDMTDEPGDPLSFWSRWPAIPAVARGRVIHLDPKMVTLPGPYLDRSLALLVEALHGSAAREALAARVSRPGMRKEGSREEGTREGADG